MSIEDARGPLEELLKVEREINFQGGLISHLVQRMDNQVSPTLIAAVLEELAVEGKVELYKQNDVYDGVRYINKAPVKTKSSEKTDVQEVHGETSQLIVDLNAALATLRHFADSEGKVSTSSCTRLILEKLSCAQDYAAKLNTILGRLKLRRSVNRGGGAYDHYVDLNNTVVTEVMYQELVASSSVKEPAKKVSRQNLLPPKPEQPSEEEPTPLEVADHLAGVVSRLEQEVERLKGENAALKTENTDLRTQLTNQTISPQVKQVLQRFPLS